MTESGNTSQQPAEADLLQEVIETPTKDLVKGVQNVDHLSEDDLGGRLRAGKLWIAKHTNRIRAVFYWAFCIVMLLLICEGAYYLTQLIKLYMKNVMSSQELIDQFLAQVWDTVLIIFATLFVEHSVKKD